MSVTSSSPIKAAGARSPFTQSSRAVSRVGFVPFLAVVLTVLALVPLAGCIADTAEDSDLPWASNKSWEGMGPIAPAMLDRYD